MLLHKDTEEQQEVSLLEGDRKYSTINMPGEPVMTPQFNIEYIPNVNICNDDI